MPTIYWRKCLRKSVSEVTAVILLILVVLVAGIITYMWVTGFIHLPTGGSVEGKEAMKIEGVIVLMSKYRSNYGYGLRVYIRNIGDKTIILENRSLFVLSGEKVIAIGLTPFNEITIKKNEVKSITYYIGKEISPGVYTIKVTSKSGVEAITRVKIPRIANSMILIVTEENDESNKVIAEDDFAIYEAWYETIGDYYRIWWKIVAKIDLNSGYRAELLNSTYARPEWVGDNPYYLDSLPAGWYDTQYWEPVKPSEMPVYIIFTVYP